jgi:hypothetical protein
MNITVEPGRIKTDDKRFSVQIAPLSRYAGEDREGYRDNLESNGTEEFYDHCLGLPEENAGRSALLMVHTLLPGWTHFPDGPHDATPMRRRFDEPEW